MKTLLLSSFAAITLLYGAAPAHADIDIRYDRPYLGDRIDQREELEDAIDDAEKAADRAEKAADSLEEQKEDIAREERNERIKEEAEDDYIPSTALPIRGSGGPEIPERSFQPGTPIDSGR